MFSMNEIKRNLLGSLEIALFMPQARNRFGSSPDEAWRSFIVPILLFPLTLLSVYLYPKAGISDHSANTIALLYSLRLGASWISYLGFVYFLVRRVDRREHFCQFVIASNWLSVPATFVFLPVAWGLMTGNYSWNELYPFMQSMMIYSYLFTAYMIGRVLRVPWELAGFIAITGFIINDYSLQILSFVGHIL